jgi:predicted ATPase
MQVINFGPIDNADIQLTNCSFFAGKNNVGKSVMAHLVYSIMKVFSPTMEEVSNYLPELVENELTKLIEELVKKSSKTKPSPQKSSKKSTRKSSQKSGGIWKVSQRDIKRIAELSQKNREKIKKRINEELSSYCHDKLKERIMSEITYVFSASVYDYIRQGEDNARINFMYEDTIYNCIFSLGIYKKSQSTRAETRIVVDDNFLNKYIEELFKTPIKHLKGKNIRYRWEKDGKLSVKYPYRPPAEKLYDMPSEIYKPWRTYYIPAGRAGLLEGYKVVSSAFYKTAPTAAFSEGEPPSITGVVADYYSLLMNFKGKKGHFNKMATDMLSKTMEGVLEVDSSEHPFSMMRYRIKPKKGKDMVIDMTNASSMVKELAPLYMVVAEKLQPNDMLIIEEPESHLQSKTQLELAEFFFELAKDGVRILVTTHSELMLRQSFQMFNQKDLSISGNLFIFKLSE